MITKAAIVAAAYAAGMGIAIAPAHAFPPGSDPAAFGFGEPNCERVPFLGLSPRLRTICDTPLAQDGSWWRYRLWWHTSPAGSECGVNTTKWVCDQLPTQFHIRNPLVESDATYRVTADTIPEGEPGHLG